MAVFHRCILLAGLVLLSLHYSAQAREWTNETGEKKITADFVELDGDMVSLKLPNGRVAQLSIYRLSRQDQMFVHDEHRRTLGNPVKLTAAQEKMLAEIVGHVRTAAKKYGDLSDEEFGETIRGPLTEVILLHSAKLVKDFGSRRVLSAIVAALVEDPDLLVRAAGLSAAYQMGENVIAAAPQIMAHVDDENETIASLANTLMFQWTDYGEALLPACLEALEGNSLKRAEYARRLLTSLREMNVAGWDEAAVRLGKVVLDTNRPEKIRMVAASGLSQVFAYTANRSVVQGYGEYSALGEFTISTETHARHEKLLRALMARLDKEHILICTSILEMIREQQPALLKEIPPATVMRLLNGSSRDFASEDEDFDRWGYSTPLLWGTHHPEAPLMVPTDEMVKMLQSEDGSVRQFASQKAPAKADELVKEAEFIKLLKADDMQIRRMAVQIISTPSSNSFTKLPQLKLLVAADPQGNIAKLTIGKETLTKVSSLAEAIKRQVPTVQQAAGTDPDLLLKKAAEDSDSYVRELAVEGLMQRQSAQAKSILKQLAKESLREDVRENAQSYVRQLEYQNGRGEEIDYGRGVEPGVKKQEESVPPFVVEMTVDPKLQMTEFISLLDALHESVMYGARWAITVPGQDHPTVLQMLPNKTRPWEHRSPLLQLTIGSAEQGNQIRMPNQPNLQVPSLAAARFFVMGMLEHRMPGEHNMYRHNIITPDFGNMNDQQLVLVTVTPEARLDQGQFALEAITFDPKNQFGSPQLVQSITWFQEGKPRSSWYIRAVK